jgi:SAM-dependent methyltransferase
VRVKSRLRPLRQQLCYLKFKLTNSNSNTVRFTCPVCLFEGPFEDVHDRTGLRKHAKCPRCGALERHRAQLLTLQEVFRHRSPAQLSLLHFAPEPFFGRIFRGMFGRYETADIEMDGVDHRADLLNLPFPDASYDVVFASHVLEHIIDDHKAIAEIRRILRPGGIAVLPVPLVGERTVEYGQPYRKEWRHVRAPGYDYYERYRPYFSRVEEYGSEAFPERYQVYIYEDRTAWPSADFPKRTASPGEKHREVVPVCYV